MIYFVDMGMSKPNYTKIVAHNLKLVAKRHAKRELRSKLTALRAAGKAQWPSFTM